MVFSLFKKAPEKMPTRPAAKPRAPAAPAATPAEGAVPAGPPSESPAAKQAPAPARPPVDDDLESLDFTGIQIEESLDPLDLAIEQAAIDFANEDDELAASVLSEQIQAADPSPKAERVWLMLFDLHRATGNRDGFAALELEYARRFEKQPPVWKDVAGGGDSPARAGGAAVLFRGDLVGSNAAGFAQLAQGLEANPKARFDFGKVKSVDVAGCEQLLAFLAGARKKKAPVELVGLESLVTLLAARIAEAATEQVYWRTQLECFQRQGRQEDFDNLAVDFAVAFEISPPSWDPLLAPAKPAAAAAKTADATKAAKAVERPAGDAYIMSGEIRGGKFDGLDAYLAAHEQSVLDMAAVERMDFTSAGTLLNILTSHWQRGVAITLRHPNRLVGELLNVVGVGAMVSVVYAKA